MDRRIRKWEVAVLCVALPLFALMAALAPTNARFDALPFVLRCVALGSVTTLALLVVRVVVRALFGAENSPWE